MSENNRDEDLDEVEEVKAEEPKEEIMIEEIKTEGTETVQNAQEVKPSGNKLNMLSGIGIGSLVIIIQSTIISSLGSVNKTFTNCIWIVLAVLEIAVPIYLIAVKKEKRFGIGLFIGYTLPFILSALFILLIFGACVFMFGGFQ